MGSYSRIIKVFVAGEGGVGKTTLIERYVMGMFNQNTIMTIGVAHSIKEVTLSTGEIVNLQIWDLGGEDRFRSILPLYLKGAMAGLIVFDLARYSTFKNLPEWIEIIQGTLGPDVPIFLIGSKNDLVSEVSHQEEVDDLVSKYKFLGYFPTSAKTGEHVEECFTQLARKVLE
jgi:small GTP-binding protein